MSKFAKIDLESKGTYIQLLSSISKLSGLFSDSAIPLINYRVAENIFCKSFNAENLSRSDTAFDAKFNSEGVGLKTFTCPSKISLEKVAEFNSLSNLLNTLKGKELAIKLSEFRNDRIDLATRTYGIETSYYHIVARREKELLLFETDYSKIDINNINNVLEKASGLTFNDGQNFYSFNRSKSTLYRKFELPDDVYKIPIEIVDDPFKLLLELVNDKELVQATDKLVRGKDYIILPLYGLKNKFKYVFERSGLNQWNARGRQRDPGEVYIPVPKIIHSLFEGFFPDRDQKFNLTVPTKEILSAKLCQENSKALMTDPNKALSNWLLRKVLKLEEGELATIGLLDELGFDSVIIKKHDINNYSIDIMPTDSFEQFINNENFEI